LTIPFRVRISAAGNGYLAENDTLEIAAGGASIAEAGEMARTIALEVLNRLREPAPEILLARIEDPSYVAFVTRPFERQFQTE
jgi:hypothetical protein